MPPFDSQFALQAGLYPLARIIYYRVKCLGYSPSSYIPTTLVLTYVCNYSLLEEGKKAKHQNPDKTMVH